MVAKSLVSLVSLVWLWPLIGTRFPNQEGKVANQLSRFLTNAERVQDGQTK